MAVLSIRKGDVEAITEILNNDTYETPNDMARAVLKEAFEILRRRELYTVAFRLGSLTLFYGIEGTEAAAKKFAEGMGLGEARVVRLFSMSDFEQRLTEQHQLELEAQPDPCAKCGKFRWQHSKFIGANGKPLANQGAKKHTPCTTYTHPALLEETA